MASLASGRFAIRSGGKTQYLAYASNDPIDERNPLIRRIVISFHGNGGDAPQYRANAIAGADAVPGSLTETLIVAPQFASEEDIIGPVPRDVLTWNGYRFWGGLCTPGPTGTPRPFTISSFDCIDQLVEALLNRDLFPNVAKLVLVGHSGGGQLVNRYAASSARIVELTNAADVSLHFIPMNPGNYLYMDNRRIGSPGNDFYVPKPRICPVYDVYGWGLSANLMGYHASQGMFATAMRDQYEKLRVTYLLGQNDNSMDPNDKSFQSMPKECMDMLQGVNRLERGRIYQRHLRSVYGDSITDRHRAVEVPGVGHWGEGMMKSPEGSAVIYEPVEDFTAQVLEMAVNGAVLKRSDRRQWSEGWTQAKAYPSSGQSFLFLLKEDSGKVHINRLGADGVVGTEVKRYDWSSDWTTASFYIAGGATYLFLLKRTTGDVHVHRINQDGTVGPSVMDVQWSQGWTHAEPFYIGPTPFLFLLKSGSGDVHIHQINVDGKVGARVFDENWTTGWTTATFYKAAGKTILLLLKSGDGKLHTHVMNLNGTVGPRLETKDWSSGWTNAIPFTAGTAPFLMFVKRNEGRVEIRQVNADGTIGGYAQKLNWTQGWSSLTHYSAGPRSFVVCVKKQKAF